MEYTFKPIGLIESCFKFKNGTPRQSSVCGQARATLTINTEVYSNPDHSLIGLEEFSHVWVIFVFHQNNNAYKKAKVKPPRLNGAKVGVFSTRSPYRLNNIGLTLAKIEGIDGATLHLSGIDMLDGTPVLDIKPYIPLYDKPRCISPTTQPEQPLVSAGSSQFPVVTQFPTDTPVSASVPSESDVTRGIDNEEMNTCDYATGDAERRDDNDPDKLSHQSLAKGNRAKMKKTGRGKSKGKCTEKESYTINVLDEASGLFVSKDTPNSYALDKNLEPINPVLEASKAPDQITPAVETSKNLDPKNPLLENSKDLDPINPMEPSMDLGPSNHVLDTSKNLDPINSIVEHVPNSCKQKGQQHIKVTKGQGPNNTHEAEYACWIKEPPYQKLTVRFTIASEEQLLRFSTDAEQEEFRLKYLKCREEARVAIRNILEADPRSSYRRQKCVDRLYFFMVDVLHVTCWFNDDDNVAEVVRIKPNREKMMQKLAEQK